ALAGRLHLGRAGELFGCPRSLLLSLDCLCGLRVAREAAVQRVEEHIERVLTSASPHVHLGGSDLSLLLARFRIADGVLQFWRVAGGSAADRSRAGSRGSAQRRVAAS